MNALPLPHGAPRVFGAAGIAISLLAAGCAPRAHVQLLQPNAPPAQRHIQLAGDWAYTSLDGTRREFLLDFPLPQSKSGPRDFRLFLSLAASSNQQSIDPDDSSAARGFLIQAVGNLKGKTSFTSGTIRSRSVPLERRQLRLDFDLLCADGSRITGTAKVFDDETELRSFKRRYAPDVAALDARATARAVPAADESANSTNPPASGTRAVPKPDSSEAGSEEPNATPARGSQAAD